METLMNEMPGASISLYNAPNYPQFNYPYVIHTIDNHPF